MAEYNPTVWDGVKSVAGCWLLIIPGCLIIGAVMDLFLYAVLFLIPILPMLWIIRKIKLRQRS